jgi:hypothetical protein
MKISLALRLLAYLLFGTTLLFAQPLLPRHTMSIIPTQGINFGTFCLTSLSGTGGTTTVDWQGTRSASGDVILLQASPTSQPAIFDVKLCQGRNVIISYSSTITLTGSNGGTMTLNLGPSEYGANGSQFPIAYDCDFVTHMRMGGTLVVGPYSSNPEGIYTGSFEITFDQE